MKPAPLFTRIAAGALAAVAWTAPAAAQADTDIYLLDLERGPTGLTAGPPRAVTNRAGYDNQPAFTADGALLYTSIRDGQADTYRYDPTTGEVRVTTTPESEYSPTPIPGSDRFSVVRVEADSAQRLWSFAADGTDPRLVLPDVAPVGYHAWAADRVALYVLGEPPTLEVANPATGAVRTVARGIGRSLQPVPGREAVSFTQDTGDGWLIRELDVAEPGIRTLAVLLGPDEYHAWTPDGTLLTAHGTRVFRLGAGEWQPLVDVGPFGLGSVSRLAVSPDGRSLALVVDRPADADPAREQDSGG